MLENVSKYINYKQMLIKQINGSFEFQFSLYEGGLYIDSLDQTINYGWESPSVESKSKSKQRVSYSENQTDNSINISGITYSIGKHELDYDDYSERRKNLDDDYSNIKKDGIKEFAKLKKVARTPTPIHVHSSKKGKKNSNKYIGALWSLYTEDGNRGSSKIGEKWYISEITQNSTEFITGINAMKMTFTIAFNEYK